MGNTIILGAGCFWCVEAVFTSISGVTDVDVGYCNGDIKNPTYEVVCEGKSGYAEVARISFNDERISLEEILDIFFKIHDPTTLNRQGADIGTQYRSGIFYENNAQKEISIKVLKKWEDSGYFSDPIITEISKLNHFYIAENYHQEYYKNNQNAPYCRLVIKPKLEKIYK